jgi:hypothetical protein
VKFSELSARKKVITHAEYLERLRQGYYVHPYTGHVCDGFSRLGSLANYANELHQRVADITTVLGPWMAVPEGGDAPAWVRYGLCSGGAHLQVTTVAVVHPPAASAETPRTADGVLNMAEWEIHSVGLATQADPIHSLAITTEDAKNAADVVLRVLGYELRDS